jgi:hypothetical protein
MSTVETGATEEQQIETPVEETQTAAPAEKATPDWVPRRMGELAAQRRAAEQRAEQAEQRAREREAEIAALRAGGGQQTEGTGQNVTELARAYAAQLRDQEREQERQEREQQSQVEEFNRNLQAVQSAGDKEFGEDFKKSVDTLLMAGVGGQQFLQVVFDVPSPEKVIAYLGKPENVEEAIRVSQLSPTKMAVEMTKLAGKAAKEMSKQISKAPPPVDTVGGSSGSGGPAGVEPDPKNAKAWMEWRSKSKKSRR